MKHYDINKDMRYLQLLAQSFPTVAEASTEIINLQAILNLPKGTEHFLADIHGEYEAFLHVLKNASGNIKRKVNELFGNTLREAEKRELCTLIYYPEQKLELVKQNEPDINDWYHITLHQLVAVCRDVSSKYTRSKVRKSLPHHHIHRPCRRLHHRHSQCDTAACHRPAAHPRRHLRPWTRCTHHPRQDAPLPQLGYTMGQPRRAVDGCCRR